ncbi:MAG: bis(5'-nucleosyl)-tetraphosphatase (symmetrical) YqeK [Lachnospiraceae bacterium]|nr:bis(5'-nucleosyl)-tetraphosphatase (symmetrical) YqeK [Lachnospiraceae bacterium]
MNDERLDEKFIYSLYGKMDKNLKRHRYVHSVGVAGTAASLAMKYKEDINKAHIAGILHDCAKCYNDEELLRLCEKNMIGISDFERDHGFLLHAKYGAFLAKDKYGIDDEDILSAIRWHTTGKENMTLLEEIVFVADYIEPSRNRLGRLGEIREAAFNETSLDKAMMMILEETIGYLKRTGGDVDEAALRAYEYYKGKGNI